MKVINVNQNNKPQLKTVFAKKHYQSKPSLSNDIFVKNNDTLSFKALPKTRQITEIFQKYSIMKKINDESRRVMNDIVLTYHSKSAVLDNHIREASSDASFIQSRFINRQERLKFQQHYNDQYRLYKGFGASDEVAKQHATEDAIMDITTDRLAVPEDTLEGLKELSNTRKLNPDLTVTSKLEYLRQLFEEKVALKKAYESDMAAHYSITHRQTSDLQDECKNIILKHNTPGSMSNDIYTEEQALVKEGCEADETLRSLWDTVYQKSLVQTQKEHEAIGLNNPKLLQNDVLKKTFYTVKSYLTGSIEQNALAV